MEYVDDGMVIFRLLSAYQGAIYLFNVSVCHMQKEQSSLGLYLTRKCNLHTSYHSALLFLRYSSQIPSVPRAQLYKCRSSTGSCVSIRHFPQVNCSNYRPSKKTKNKPKIQNKTNKPTKIPDPKTSHSLKLEKYIRK